MNQNKKSTVDVSAVKEYLERYRVYENLLTHGRRMLTRHPNVLGSKPIDINATKAAMLSIRAFIMTLPDCREKMMLYYRYLYGRTVEQCAELLDVSRRTAFRIYEKALIFAAENYPPR